MSIPRTPTTSSGQNQGPTISNCIDCVEPDNNEMVQCDDCDSWTHFSCANVSASIADPNVKFCCSFCRAGKTRTTPTSTTETGTIPKQPTNANVDRFRRYREPLSEAAEAAIEQLKQDHDRSTKELHDKYQAEMSELRRTIRELGKQLNREPDHQVLDQMNNLSIHEAPTTHGNLGVFPATNTTVITASTPVSYLGAPPIPSTIGPTNVPVPGTPNLNMWPPNGQNYHHAFLTPSGVVSHYTTRPSMQNAPIFTSVYQPGTMATSASNGPNLPNTTFVQETSRPSFVPGSPYGNGNVSVYEALTAAQLTARKAMKTDLPKF